MWCRSRRRVRGARTRSIPYSEVIARSYAASAREFPRLVLSFRHSPAGPQRDTQRGGRCLSAHGDRKRVNVVHVNRLRLSLACIDGEYHGRERAWCRQSRSKAADGGQQTVKTVSPTTGG